MCRVRPTIIAPWPAAPPIGSPAPGSPPARRRRWPTTAHPPGYSSPRHNTRRPHPPFAPPFPESRTIARKPPAPPTETTKAATGKAPARPRARSAVAGKIPAPPGTPRKKATVAGPARKRARGAPLPSERLDELQKIIVTCLEDDKAENIITLDLAGRASFTDRMVIATGLADRQIAAMATHLDDKLSAAGLKRIQVEGAGGSDWVLIDAGDIVIHLFKPEAREMYGLERMWGSDLDEAAEDPQPAPG